MEVDRGEIWTLSVENNAVRELHLFWLTVKLRYLDSDQRMKQINVSSGGCFTRENASQAPSATYACCRNPFVNPRTSPLHSPSILTRSTAGFWMAKDIRYQQRRLHGQPSLGGERHPRSYPGSGVHPERVSALPVVKARHNSQLRHVYVVNSDWRATERGGKTASLMKITRHGGPRNYVESAVNNQRNTIGFVPVPSRHLLSLWVRMNTTKGLARQN